VFNKIDSVSLEEVERLSQENEGKNVMISCEMDLGLDILLERIWEELRLVKYVIRICALLLHVIKLMRLLAKGIHQKARRITGLVGSRLSASWCNDRDRLSQYSSRPGFAFQIRTRLGQVK
jgi:hypothetical protein